jgi:hypothetical protein
MSKKKGFIGLEKGSWAEGLAKLNNRMTLCLGCKKNESECKCEGGFKVLYRFGVPKSHAELADVPKIEPAKRFEIKLKNPKTCNHCPAFFHSMGGSQACSLGYKTKRVPLSEAKTWVHYNTWEDLTIRIIPDEPCPKPKNISECVKIRKMVDVLRHCRVGSPEYEKENKGSREMTREESLRHYVNLKKD